MKDRISILLLGSAVALFSSCLNSGEDTIVLPDREQTPEVSNQLISSSGWGKITADNGSELTVPKLSVPKNEKGEDASVYFSLETSPTHSVDLPRGMTPVGDYVKVEPFNFTFNVPLVLDLPLKGATDMDKLFVYRFDENTDTWKMVPISGIGSNGKSVTVNVNDLGYYVLVRTTEIPEARRMGGIRFVHPSGGEKYFYSLTILGVENKFGNEQERVAVGTLARTIQLNDGGPSAMTYLTNLPQGRYIILLSRERRNSFSSEMNQMEYYSKNFDITVESGMTIPPGCELKLTEWGGWASLYLNGSDGNWIEGRPSIWGEVTKTYGKGEFQATLTWVNDNQRITDYDLHLYGPNGLHIYFSNKGTVNDAFNLDRDWTTPAGNAIENIYSIKDVFPAGEYVVKVHLYSGTTNRNFNVRIIQNNTVVKSMRSSIGTQKGEQEIYRFTVK